MKKCLIFLIAYFCSNCVMAHYYDDDSDGFVEICGDIDNCPGISNPNQADYDSDGIGDVCDTDPGLPDTSTESESNTNTDTDSDTWPELPAGCAPLPGGRLDDLFQNFRSSTVENILLDSTMNPDIFGLAGDSHKMRGNTSPYSYHMGNCALPWYISGMTSQYRSVECYPEMAAMFDVFDTAWSGGESLFTRVSTTAVGGMNSAWLVDNPVIIWNEVNTLTPAYVIIMFGTNDYPNILAAQTVNNVMRIADYFADSGAVPIVMSPPLFPVDYTPDWNINAVSIADGLSAECAVSGYPFVDLQAVVATLSLYGLRTSSSEHLTSSWWSSCNFSSSTSYTGEYYHTLMSMIAVHLLHSW